MDGWRDGGIDGWMEGLKVILWIAHSNHLKNFYDQKFISCVWQLTKNSAGWMGGGKAVLRIAYSNKTLRNLAQWMIQGELVLGSRYS